MDANRQIFLGRGNMVCPRCAREYVDFKPIQCLECGTATAWTIPSWWGRQHVGAFRRFAVLGLVVATVVTLNAAAASLAFGKTAVGPRTAMAAGLSFGVYFVIGGTCLGIWHNRRFRRYFGRRPPGRTWLTTWRALERLSHPVRNAGKSGLGMPSPNLGAIPRSSPDKPAIESGQDRRAFEGAQDCPAMEGEEKSLQRNGVEAQPIHLPERQLNPR